MKKRSLTIAGHRTSVSLEDPFWEALKQVAGEQRRSLASLVAEIDAARGRQSLSSALRLFVFQHFKRMAAPAEGLRPSPHPAGGHVPLDREKQ